MNDWTGIAFAQDADASARAVSQDPEVPLFEGLGTYHRAITTESADAQRYFDQGCCFMFAFNHDESIRSFQAATRFDPDCAMAWWGVAMACGPHVNNPVVPPERSELAWKAIQEIQRIRDSEESGPAATVGTAAELTLLDAVTQRFAAEAPDDRKALDEAYAQAMTKAWEEFPDDPDVGALYAESMMDLRPWDYWDDEGKPQPGTESLVAALEKVQKIQPDHPLALHLYIHALEASPRAADAVTAANRLRTLQPGLGHMVHMPSHIDIRTGDWHKAIKTNQRAIAADDSYRKLSPKQGFYRLYMAHNRHMLGFAAMMTGQSDLAADIIRQMVDAMPEEWVKENRLFADGFVSSPLEVMVRFGRWDEILAEPEPPEYLPVTRSMRHKARSIAWATKGDVANAEKERDAFLEARKEVSDDATIGNNPAHDVLAVAEKLLNGEILYRKGDVQGAIAELGKGVELEDALRYDEPPDWINPVRHALGAILLKEKKFAEAETVFRADLKVHPENGWSLFGLARSLEGLGKVEEAKAVEQRFQTIWRDADITIRTPCLCQQDAE